MNPSLCCRGARPPNPESTSSLRDCHQPTDTADHRPRPVVPSWPEPRGRLADLALYSVDAKCRPDDSTAIHVGFLRSTRRRERVSPSPQPPILVEIHGDWKSRNPRRSGSHQRSRERRRLRSVPGESRSRTCLIAVAKRLAGGGAGGEDEVRPVEAPTGGPVDDHRFGFDPGGGVHEDHAAVVRS